MGWQLRQVRPPSACSTARRRRSRWSERSQRSPAAPPPSPSPGPPDPAVRSAAGTPPEAWRAAGTDVVQASGGPAADAVLVVRRRARPARRRARPAPAARRQQVPGSWSRSGRGPRRRALARLAAVTAASHRRAGPGPPSTRPGSPRGPSDPGNRLGDNDAVVPSPSATSSPGARRPAALGSGTTTGVAPAARRADQLRRHSRGPPGGRTVRSPRSRKLSARRRTTGARPAARPQTTPPAAGSTRSTNLVQRAVAAGLCTPDGAVVPLVGEAVRTQVPPAGAPSYGALLAEMSWSAGAACSPSPARCADRGDRDVPPRCSWPRPRRPPAPSTDAVGSTPGGRGGTPPLSIAAGAPRRTWSPGTWAGRRTPTRCCPRPTPSRPATPCAPARWPPCWPAVACWPAAPRLYRWTAAVSGAPARRIRRC
ncbi:hypothetical protein HBB16_01165 [Pseudonocardia sp. MCCB 268]|nr:hypothetical protein [Pseudonocardia cytotoxica]